jgi:hypothetical protein
MMDRVGVDAAAQEGHALAIAARRCLFCANTAACGDWLQATERADSAPAFCPNQALFARCKRASEKID